MIVNLLADLVATTAEEVSIDRVRRPLSRLAKYLHASGAPMHIPAAHLPSMGRSSPAALPVQATVVDGFLKLLMVYFSVRCIVHRYSTLLEFDCSLLLGDAVQVLLAPAVRPVG